jgi:hypothetical protein
MKKSSLRPYFIRLAIVLAIALVFALAFNEVTYTMQKEPTDRGPKTISLVVPLGTAQRLASGEKLRILPEEMVFVVGDVLEVKNNDAAGHQLGPIYVPPGATSSLVLDKAEKLTYECSFQSNRYLGLDVRTATTIGTRLIALLLTAPTLAALMFLYSLAAFPIKAGSPPIQPV